VEALDACVLRRLARLNVHQFDLPFHAPRQKMPGDRGGFQIEADSYGYPPTLGDLVKGVDVGGKKMRFLRRIPIDPMTGTTEWGMRSMQDDPDSDSWGGQNVFDVYTKSEGTGLDGTKYKDWRPHHTVAMFLRRHPSLGRRSRLPRIDPPHTFLRRSKRLPKSFTNQMVGFSYTYMRQDCCPCAAKSFV